MTDQTAPHPRARNDGGVAVLALLVKVLFLGTVVGVAFALTPTLVGQQQWPFLIGIWAISAVLVATYATGRALPAKYLVPGTLLLVLFVVYPIVLTAKLSTTNFGDGTRSSKEEAVARIIGASVRQTPDAPRYNLTVGTTGTVSGGPFTLFLVAPDGATYSGDAEGLVALGTDEVAVTDGFVREADGYTMLTAREINEAGPELADLVVPTETGAIRQLGISQAFEGRSSLRYDEAADTITDVDTGTVYTVQQRGDREYYTSPDGERISDQSWTANVGLDNYKRALTDRRISRDFLRIFVWTVAFATLSVGLTFILGLLLATTLNDARVRGQKIYRALLIMPYAIPGFISLLVWASFFNRDFGLINSVTGLNINWLGDPTMAKVAVLLTNLWMGFPYMFLVCTGALQAISGELKEAARMDGASGWAGFTRITFPLLLVIVAPLLVASFAFNFNNFNAIQLLTQGGPFSPDNPTAGGTDILISYTIRLAFGAGGAQIGFASAISVLLFVITGVIAALQFRATKALEDVN
ncbi:ABC transporter permease subunit [Nocardioides sp.]|uniref:ABC transporter permease subunit n=1 Tax=Nocardioides sp. TaxID=35761 RepID=UPI002732B480|nr:ABC transporter permease subunit [Nocardioides sp.]MDP3890199.1 ABC transporter permease subunit [Nocardioides sp.]